jgi:hypothetical protein
MLDFSQTNILKLAITWSGNKTLNEGTVVPNQTLVSVNDFAHEVLITAFFKPFEKSEEFFYFCHDEDLSQNRVYQACMQIFSNPDLLTQEAAELTQLFYEFSTTPKLTGGEFFVALFDAVELQGEAVPVIGMFKIVQKDSFLRVERSTEHFALGVGEGIATGKLALAALIFGVDEAEGYRILLTDTVTKKDETSMWRSQFLNVRPIEDHYFNTRHYMNIASEFIQEKAAKFAFDKTDQIDLQNRSAFYFKENEEFEVENFAETLFDEPEQREAFMEYRDEYIAQTEAPLEERFDISKQAVRKSVRIFKNVIKLDENFQIYVKGRRDWIERGFDEEKGRPFYKIYFEQEE